MKKILVSVLVMVLAVALALPATMVAAVDGSWVLYGTIGGKYLVTIDSGTGDATEVAPFGGDISETGDAVYAIAFDSNTGTLYGLARMDNTGRSPYLATIDVVTADVAVIAAIYVDGDPDLYPYFAEGFAVAPDGTIYVSMSMDGAVEGGDYYSETLATVDSSTAEATVVGIISGTVQNEADGLEFVGATLYGTDDPGSGPTNIYTYNTGTAAPTAKGTLSSPRFNNVNDMAYNPDSTLLYGFDPGAKTNGAPRHLCTISHANGAVATDIGVTHIVSEFDGGTMAGIAWVFIEEDEPFTTVLCAAQDIPVGNVIVDDDGTTLTVTYEITDLDWIITETHLYVGQNIPFTSAPGQFPYDDGDAVSVTDTEVTYEILLNDIDSYSPKLNKKSKPTGVMVADDDPGVISGDPVYIAAHAVVMRLIDGCWETVWQIGDVEAAQMDNPVDEFNYPAIVAGPYDFYVGTTPQIEFPWITREDSGLADPLNIHFNTEMPYGGQLSFSWSPGGSGHEIVDVDLDLNALGNLIRDGVVTPGWWDEKERFVETFAVDQLAAGGHTLTFDFSSGDGSVWDWFLLEKPCIQEETAWGGACDSENYARYDSENGYGDFEEYDNFVYFFNPPPGQGDGGNWASFFVYQIK